MTQSILDDLKAAVHGAQHLESEREKILLSGVIKRYRDLKKYVKDLES